jgi:hypothetical protein
LRLEWSRLAREYQAALPVITSIEEWTNTFDSASTVQPVGASTVQPVGR